MSVRRRTTVHDLASLRIHPDGSRVQSGRIKSDERNSSAQDGILRPRRAHYVGRDAKGNWVAADAGGKVSVKAFKAGTKRKSNADSSDEEIRMDLDQDENQDVKGGVKDARAKKRKLFYEDYSFLEDTSSQAGPSRSVSRSLPSSAQAAVQSELDVPSSDFLKCIHHFASNYYHTKGNLYDAGKEARAERKARKAKQLQRMQEDGDSDAGNRSSSSSSSESDEEADDVQSTSSNEEDGQTQDRSRNTTSKWPRKRKLKRESENLRKDMYKAFDGSALIAIGVLLQEHIFEMLDRKPPEGWEEEFDELEARDGTVGQRGEVPIGGKRRRRRRTVGTGVGEGGEVEHRRTYHESSNTDSDDDEAASDPVTGE